jgi:hypothetical protein
LKKVAVLKQGNWLWLPKLGKLQYKSLSSLLSQHMVHTWYKLCLFVDESH